MREAVSLRDDVARFARDAGEVALCLDFDGTLAPIVDDPTTSKPLDGTLELLGPLAVRFAAVALVSGRPAAFLAERAPAPGVRYLGLYGLEEMKDGELHVDARLSAARPAVVAATEDLRADAAIVASGAYLEDKTYAIVVHTRRVAEAERWSTAVDEAARRIATSHGLEVVPGRLVWELRPAVRDDKGGAIRRIVAECGARRVIVVGDDLGDLPAFAAAAALGHTGHGALRVAVRSAESPPQLLEEADHVVDGPAGVLALLRLLND